MSLTHWEAAWALGGLLVFHVAVRFIGIGGLYPWGHQVIWIGLTTGSAVAWGLIFRHVMPWGHRDVIAIVRAHELFDEYYRLYAASLVILFLYYAVTSIALDWFPPTRKSPRRWPGVWWTLTHLLILPLATSFIVYDHVSHLRPPVLNQMVSVWLRYHLWLVKDSAISLYVAAASEEDYDVNEDERKGWTWIWFILWLARLHSLFQLAMWFQDCGVIRFHFEWPAWALSTHAWLLEMAWTAGMAWDTVGPPWVMKFLSRKK